MPLDTRTLPPVEDALSPANSETEAPLWLTPGPTLTRMEPPAPANDVPVDNDREPVEPPAAAPDPSCMSPLLPAPLATPLTTVTAPLLADGRPWPQPPLKHEYKGIDEHGHRLSMEEWVRKRSSAAFIRA